MTQRILDSIGRGWCADYEPPGGGIGGLDAMPEPPRVRGRIVFRSDDEGEVRECDTGEEFGLAVAMGRAEEIALLGALATATVRR